MYYLTFICPNCGLRNYSNIVARIHEEVHLTLAPLQNTMIQFRCQRCGLVFRIELAKPNNNAIVEQPTLSNTLLKKAHNNEPERTLEESQNSNKDS